MKKIALSLIIVLLFTLGFAQDRRYIDSVPEIITGEWLVTDSKAGNKVESILFFPDGLLNINSNDKRKLVQRYKVALKPNGYEVFVTAMHSSPPIGSFLITSLKKTSMEITLHKDSSMQRITLTKVRDIPSGVIPLKSR